MIGFAGEKSCDPHFQLIFLLLNLS